MNTPEIASVTWVHPVQPDALDTTRAIFQKYAGLLGVDLHFQSFAFELANLPGDYAAPRGTLRPLDGEDYASASEMKRLYMCKAFRCLGLAPTGGSRPGAVRRRGLCRSAACFSNPIAWA